MTIYKISMIVSKTGSKRVTKKYECRETKNSYIVDKKIIKKSDINKISSGVITNSHNFIALFAWCLEDTEMVSNAMRKEIDDTITKYEKDISDVRVGFGEMKIEEDLYGF